MSFTSKERPKIGIVGAGLSGLTLAYRLKEKGFSVDVYEARNRVGGRVLTIEINGHLGELGAQNITDGGQAQHLLDLMHHLAITPSRKTTQFGLKYIDKGEMIDIYERFRQEKFTPEEIKARLMKIQARSKTMKDVLNVLFKEDDFLHRALSVMLAAYEGAPVEKLSSVYVETLYHQLMGGFSSAHQKEQGGELQLMSIAEGNALLPKKLAENLKNQIHLRHVLKIIEKKGKGYLLRFENGTEQEVDLLVLTIPCPVFDSIEIHEEVIPKQRQKSISSIQYGTNAKILVPIKASKNTGGFTNGRMVAFPNHDGHLVNFYYTGGHGSFTKESIASFFHQDRASVSLAYTLLSQETPLLALDKQYATYSTAVGHSWVNDPFSLGSYSCIGAGQEESFTQLVRIKGEKVKALFSPIEETLFFAGEHTSILFDVGGTMESAVESAERMTRLITKIHANGCY